MLRLLRLSCSTKKFTPCAPGTRPEVTSPRIGSPRSGCSILMTSAPQSPRTVAAEGTNPQSATSISRMPSRICSIRARRSLRLRDDAQIRLRGLPAGRVDFLGFVIADGAGNDDLVAALPVHRGRDLVLRRQL